MDRRAFLRVTGAGLAASVGYGLLRGITRRPGVTGSAVGHDSAPVRRFYGPDGGRFDLSTSLGRVDRLDTDGRPSMSVELRNPRALVPLAGGGFRVLTLDGYLSEHDADGRTMASRRLEGLRSPQDMAADGRRLVIANTLGHELVLLEEGGAVRRVALPGDDRLNGPASVCLKPGGGFYVADKGNGRVVLLDDDGRRLDVLGGRGGPMRAPTCVRVDGRGYVSVADPVAGRVHMFDDRHRYVDSTRPRFDDGRPALAIWLAVDALGQVRPSLVPAAGPTT